MIYILPLGVRPVINPDETRYAEISREMIASGDWVVPHLDGLRYFEKPVLASWLNACSMMLFGENAFAIRLPSALATGCSALVIFYLVSVFAGGYIEGFFAAASFLTCFEVFGVGTFCVLDSVFSFFITLTFGCFFIAYTEENRNKKIVFYLLCGMFSGLAFLTKGFIAFVLPIIAIIPFVLWEKKLKDLIRISWIPILSAVVICLPWAVMIDLKEPDFWHYFIFIEHIKRFISPAGGQHPHIFWYYIPVIFAGAMPWSFFYPAAVIGLKKTRFTESLDKYALCWFLFPFLFFSASGGKLCTYVLPCFAPLAILMTTGLSKYIEKGKKRVLTTSIISFAFLIGVIAAALILTRLMGAFLPQLYTSDETFKWVIAAFGLLTWCVILMFSLMTHNDHKKLILYGAAPILFMFCVSFIFPDQVKERKAPEDFIMKYSDRILPTTLIAADSLESAACWSYKRNDVYIFRKPGELQYGIEYADSTSRLLTIDMFKKIVLDARRLGTCDVVLIAKKGSYEKYCDDLPEPVFEKIEGGFAFAQF